MPATPAEQIQETLTSPVEEYCRPLYVKCVPEKVWILVHDNAIRSRMRLQNYLIKIMAESQPFPPQPLPGQGTQNPT